jgi:hypothetical protein
MVEGFAPETRIKTMLIDSRAINTVRGTQFCLLIYSGIYLIFIGLF